MISGEVATSGLSALSVAAVMLMEDAADGLMDTSTDLATGVRLAATLAALGADLSAIAATAAVLDRHRGDNV